MGQTRVRILHAQSFTGTQAVAWTGYRREARPRLVVHGRNPLSASATVSARKCIAVAFLHFGPAKRPNLLKIPGRPYAGRFDRASVVFFQNTLGRPRCTSKFVYPRDDPRLPASKCHHPSFRAAAAGGRRLGRLRQFALLIVIAWCGAGPMAAQTPLDLTGPEQTYGSI